jgi:beta-glucosidase
MKIVLQTLLLSFTLIVSNLCDAQAEKDKLPFWDYTLSFEQRAKDVVSRLTLEEKVAQMLNATPAIPRLGIPAYDWWNEVLHGVARTQYRVTVFPQAIAMAATWDTNSLATMADYAALEGRAIHNKAIEANKTGDRYVGLTGHLTSISFVIRAGEEGRKLMAKILFLPAN